MSAEEQDLLSFLLLLFILLIVLFIVLIYQDKPQADQGYKKNIIHTSNYYNGYDYIIIGLGTSGAVLTRRLSEQYPNKRILVLERGSDFTNDPKIYNINRALEIAYTKPFSETFPIDTGGRLCSVGNMVAGSSSHNFGLVVKGTKQYYKEEFPYMNDEDIVSIHRSINQQMGMTSIPSTMDYWNFTKNMLSVAYQEKNRWRGFQVVQQCLDNAWRAPKNILLHDGFATSMLQSISSSFHLLFPDVLCLGEKDENEKEKEKRTTNQTKKKKKKAFQMVDDYNDDVVCCGSKRPQLFMDKRTFLRSSSATAYLNHEYIQNHPNITVCTDANVKELFSKPFVVANTTTNQCYGVEVEIMDKKSNEGKQRKRFYLRDSSDCKLIICAGALNSPMIVSKLCSPFPFPFPSPSLPLSSDVVDLQVPSPQHYNYNFLTHYGTFLIFKCPTKNVDHFSAGPIAFLNLNNHNNIDDDEDDNRRDLQILVGGDDVIDKRWLPNQTLDKGYTYVIIWIWLLKPRSRGTLFLSASSMKENENGDDKNIKIPFFSDGGLEDVDSDLSKTLKGLLFMRNVVERMKYNQRCYSKMEMVQPSENVWQRYDDDGNIDVLVDLICHHNISFTDHYTGSLNEVLMGTDKKVQGTNNVHVVDASSYHGISPGNTEYPCLFLAEALSKLL
jgi:hypothetical protein